MAFPKAVSQNPVASFAVGTFAIQLLVIATCLVLRSINLPHGISALPQPEPAPIVESKVSEPAPVIQEEKSAPIEMQSPPVVAEVKPPPSGTDKEITYTVKAGDTFTKIWVSQGGTTSGAIRAMKSIKSAGIEVPGIREKEKILLTLSESGDILKLQRKLKDGRILTLEGNSQEGYKASISKQNITEQERVASGTITRSFAAAAEDNSIPYSVVNDLVDLFSGRVEFNRAVHSGDSFTVIYSNRSNEQGEDLDPGPIRAASLKIDGKMLVAVRHVSKDGSVRYFDEKGEPLGNYFLRYPLQFTRISSVFATARFHPILGRSRPHNGVDFAAPIGTPVRAVADGVVISAGFSGEAGNLVKLQHGDRFSTAYLHLSRIGAGLHVGSRVTRGQTIGAVGMTGLATGPHLHFSLYDRGTYVNPLGIDLPRMPDHAEKIPHNYLQMVVAELSQQHEKVQLAYAAATSRKA